MYVRLTVNDSGTGTSTSSVYSVQGEAGIKVPNSKTQGILTLFHITRFIFFDMYERVLLWLLMITLSLLITYYILLLQELV